MTPTWACWLFKVVEATGLTQETLWTNSDQEPQDRCPWHAKDLPYSFYECVDEFSYHTSNPKPLLEQFCGVQVALAKPWQHALCQTHHLLCGNEGRGLSCRDAWDGFGPLRRKWCLGLLGWLWHACLYCFCELCETVSSVHAKVIPEKACVRIRCLCVVSHGNVWCLDDTELWFNADLALRLPSFLK